MLQEHYASEYIFSVHEWCPCGTYIYNLTQTLYDIYYYHKYEAAG